MKKIITILSIFSLLIIIVLNIVFTSVLDTSEHIKINLNSFSYIFCIILLVIILYFLTKFIDSHLYNVITNKTLFIISLTIYIVFNIIWVILINPKVIGDSVHVCNLAQSFYRENSDELLNGVTYAGITLKQYMQAYPQQITLAFIYSIFFRMIHFDIMEILRILNVIGNILTFIALYLINCVLSKKYKTNKTLLLTLILTFISLIMLSTFVYGDLPSISLCLFAVYFMMKYTETQKYSYTILASIFTMIAYMMRMNSLIFIIATIIYLFLNLFKNIKKKKLKEKLINILIVLIHLTISILPSTLVKGYYLNKYDLDKTKIYPNISYILMAMEESPRANGWYSEEIAVPALNNPKIKKEEYQKKIKERVTYFSKNIGYTFDFYTKKITSMWAENTYSAIRNNTLKETDLLENIINPLTFYQKTILILMSVIIIIILIQNRKNISLEIIFLLTIFIGGFTFHILWEAKSRYIIPYILVLIPIASININKLKK